MLLVTDIVVTVVYYCSTTSVDTDYYNIIKL